MPVGRVRPLKNILNGLNMRSMFTYCFLRKMFTYIFGTEMQQHTFIIATLCMYALRFCELFPKKKKTHAK